MELIKLEQVSIGYAKARPLLPPISFTLSEGDLVGVLGPNGAGKSTFLKTLLGLLPPLSGKLSFPAGRRPRLGYVPQNARPDMAYPLSSLQVVLMGRSQQLGLIRRPGKKDRELALAALAEVGLGQVAAQVFRSLSGGQQQRVLVARALVAEPELLVLDEPTSEMDPAAEHALLSLVSELSSTRKIGVIFVTHEISTAAGFGKQVVLIDANAQRFAAGTAEEMVSSEQMTALYGRPVEIRRENGRVLVWVAARTETNA